MDVPLAATIFLITYGLIASERLEKTAAALLGGLAMIVLGIIDQHDAFAAIDFNVIFLLAGMMILAGILRQTGFFQWVAIRSVKVAGGEPLRLLLVLSLIAAVLSAFLDNVTTVVLIAPVTLYIASVLRVSPVPFLMTEVFASNIGGAATLIGDPPNILIGSAAGLDFNAFLLNVGPPVAAILVVVLATLVWMFRNDLKVHSDVRDAVLALDESEVITDHRMLRLSLIVIGLTLLAFLVHGAIGLEPATIALLGATVLILISRFDPALAFHEVEWPTLFFFVGLFMLIDGLAAVGIIAAVADTLLRVTAGDAAVTTLGVLWVSGIASGLVDNIPYTAAVIPLVERLGASGVEVAPLWWALSLGANLGGNATIIGASANVIVVNVAKEGGHPIRFGQFFRYGAIVVLESLILASAYLWIRYLA
ncbi:MAG: ArsB/NhaD family transporter [Chloroflexota bacterium]|mgnify:CR=1 FL=1